MLPVRRRWPALAALVVVLIGEFLAAALFVAGRSGHIPAGAPLAGRPGGATPASAPTGSAGTHGTSTGARSVAVPAGSSARAAEGSSSSNRATTGAAPLASNGGTASAPVAVEPGSEMPSTTSVPPVAPVSCQTDLALAAAPATGYNFLCRQAGTPLTWATSSITLYEQGLSPEQSAALTLALDQWQSAARFTVTMAADQASADVDVTAAALSADQPGYTEDGYTTVSYRCVPRCAYYHASVTLSSTAGLTRTDWVATALHELGHVAGLNHVSETSAVMYPYLTLTSPAVYASGDRQGLAILAAERSA